MGNSLAMKAIEFVVTLKFFPVWQSVSLASCGGPRCVSLHWVLVKSRFSHGVCGDPR